MNKRSATKAATAADVERVLEDAARVRDELTDLLILIGAGQCEPLPGATGYARRCINFSRVYGEATSHFLCRAELQDRTK